MKTRQPFRLVLVIAATFGDPPCVAFLTSPASELSSNGHSQQRRDVSVPPFSPQTFARLPYFLDDNDDIGPTTLSPIVSPPVTQSSSPSRKASGQATTFLTSSVPGPPLETKPDYENIVGPLGRWADQIFLKMFRDKLAEQVYRDEDEANRIPLSPDGTYQEIIDLAAALNRRSNLSRQDIQERARETLVQLFPSWMPPQYAVLFSKPFPAFAARMNAWATFVAGTWLMGECEINNVEVDENSGDGGDGVNQGLLVKRCRFLEESGCASVCVNSCKIPTQTFFAQNMGLPLLMEPNYETFECQFSFGRVPTAETELVAELTPCLQRCPTVGSLRALHDATADSRANDRKESSDSDNCPMIKPGQAVEAVPAETRC